MTNITRYVVNLHIQLSFLLHTLVIYDQLPKLNKMVDILHTVFSIVISWKIILYFENDFTGVGARDPMENKLALV